MNLQLSKKNLILVFSVLLTIALVVGSYFYILSPLKTKIDLLQNELATEEKLYDALAKQVGTTKTSVMENSRVLQKKLPVESFLEQFILDLEKAEVVSNSLIEDMSFQDNSVSENDVIIEESTDQVEGQEQNTNDGQENNPAETDQPASTVPGIPEGIKRVTVNLTVTSANFFDMIKFLDTIENLERITKIDSLSFTGGEEILSLDQEIEELTYTVVISTFYYPALEELKDELPVFDTPPPSNKDNPLPTGMYYKEDQASADKKDEKAKTDESETAEANKNNSKSSVKQPANKSESTPTEQQSKSQKKQAIMGGNPTEEKQTMEIEKNNNTQE